jgi:tetratricopeptide (TPR) repeat protein
MQVRAVILTLILLQQLVVTTAAAQQPPRLLRDVQPLSWRGCAGRVDTISHGTVQQRQEADRLAAAATQAAILGDTPAVLDLLNRAARLDPGSPDIAYHLARAHEEAGSAAGAVDAYCRYLLLAPDAPDTGEVWQHLSRLAAEANLTTDPPALAVRWFESGIAMYDRGDLAAADEAFSHAWSAGEGWAAPLYNRAVVRLAQNRRDAAVADLREYLGLSEGAAQAAEVVDLLVMLPAATRSPPGRAGALAAGLIVPGLGHFTTGRPARGAVFFGAAAAAVGAGLLVERVSVQCLTPPVDGRCPPEQVANETRERPLLMPGLGVAAAIAIVGAWDAWRGVRPRSQAAPSRSTRSGISFAPGVGVGRHGTRVEVLRVRF